MATTFLGSAHEQVTNAYANAPSFQKMAAQMGITDFHQWASAKAIDLHSRAGQQLVELVQTKVKAEFGNEVFGMLDALSECMEKISKELKLKEAKFGLTMALPLVAMQHNTLKPPEHEGPLTDVALLDEAAYWVDFAQGAYGKEDIKGYDKASVNLAIGEKPGVEVRAANLQNAGVQMPGHFVAVDRRQKAVVLGIRGTTTLSDALTDAVGEATEVEKCSGLLAHKAMLASAKAVIEKTRPALEEALRETGFPLLITGHSLGAGTAILCTVLLSRVSPLSGSPKMRCFAYAPPRDIPPLEEGRSYTQVSAGGEHTVLLRDDGRAVTCGSNGYGQCDIPVLEETVSYIQVSAGLAGTVLIRSDGSAVACGSNVQHNIPSPPKTASWLEWFRGFFAAPSSISRLRYVGSNNIEPVTKGGDRILQLQCLDEDLSMLKLSSLAGEEVLRLSAHRSDLASDIHRRIAQELKTEIQSLPVVLPDGHLLASTYRANSLATVADVMELK